MKYWIGDLCYILDPEDWQNVCKNMDNNQQGWMLLDSGKTVCVFNTIVGDGIFKDNKGNSYSVDSGTIGIAQLSNNIKNNIRLNSLGKVHIFKKIPYPYYKKNKLKINNIQIQL